MKKALFIILLFIGIGGLSSQNIEISPFYGYQFGSTIDYYGGYVKMDEGSNYGGTVGFNTGNNMIVQLSYVRNTSEILVRDVVLAPLQVRVTDANFDWISISSLRTAGREDVYGHFGLGLGLLVSTPANINTAVVDRRINSSTRMFFDIKFGGTAMFTESIGIRLQALMQFPVDWAGAYFAVGSGGPSTGISLNSSSIIFSLNGGLVFIIPK